MVNVIEVTADEMPSRLLGTAIEKFEMAEFRGKDIVALSAATSDTTLTARTEIFYSVISNCIEDQEVVDHLTVNDVWYLALLQWKRTQRNMMIKAPCKAPVYSLAGPNPRVVYSAADIDAESGDEVASVDPCNGEASSFITFDDVKVVRCDQEVFVKKPNEFVHLPYANQLDGEPYLEDKTAYLRMWIDDLDDRALPEVAEACGWIQAMQHGVIAIHLVRCPVCGRKHSANWALSVESFTL